MDIGNVMQSVNWIAVLVAALSTFLIGGIWYAVFEKGWMDANKFTKEDLHRRKMSLVFGLSFVLSFIMALNLALFIGQGNLTFGIIAGFLAGFGWVAMGIAIISLFENRSFTYILINGGYIVVSFTLMGAILGAWK